MARLMLVSSKRSAQSEQSTSRTATGSAGAHRAGAQSEGEAARRLLESNGHLPRVIHAQNGQYEFTCPFHEGPGSIERGHSTNFYLDAKTSQYYCQAGSCGESGNLQILERYFGVSQDPNLSAQFKSKDTELREFQGYLTADRRQLLYTKGLSDLEIDRFRLGWDERQGCYVIPYLENRRPVAFRFYDPTPKPEPGQPDLRVGPNGSKYWWEKADGYELRDNDGRPLKDEDGKPKKTTGSIVTDRENGVLRLFNPGSASGDDANGRVYICEGEFKAMALVRNGMAAVSVPGVTSFKPDWAQFFMHAKEVVIVMDNDNPDYHHYGPCAKCRTAEKEDCAGHNPGQEGAARLVDFFGHRAKNVILPLPKGERKTDINEYIMRDGHSYLDFEELVDGKSKASPFLVKSLAEIRLVPPPETVFLVDQGLLPKGGRLLITGAPKVGKSIFAENLALSIASGIPFLHKFQIANSNPTPGHRVLLLDRELSARSLYDRLNVLIEGRPGYGCAEEKLLVDHNFALRLDADNAGPNLVKLINSNNAEVIMLDTAYKFFSGDMENAKSVSKAFASLDFAIQETGVSVVLTHHHRKGGTGGAKSESPSPDQVMGSFLWTGWPNGTVLLNYKERSVTNPYDVIASFAAFRDAAAPEPLLIGRTKESINYKTITDFSFESLDDEGTTATYQKVHAAKMPLSTENVANVLLEIAPVIEDEFLHMAAARFGCRPETVKIHLLDILDTRTDFKREGTGVRGNPYAWRYSFDKVETPYEADLVSMGEQLEIG